MIAGRDDYLNHIEFSPQVLTGKPLIADTHIPVSRILNLIAHRCSFRKVVEDYRFSAPAEFGWANILQYTVSLNAVRVRKAFGAVTSSTLWRRIS